MGMIGVILAANRKFSGYNVFIFHIIDNCFHPITFPQSKIPRCPLCQQLIMKGVLGADGNTQVFFIN